MVFFDTSVLIAASLPEHPAHERCVQRLMPVEPATACVSVRTLAEVYNVLTGYPRKPRILPMQALDSINAFRDRMAVIDLTAEDYCKLIRMQAEMGIPGSKIHDALLAHCARKANASKLCTLNAKDFRAVAPDLADRIVEP